MVFCSHLDKLVPRIEMDPLFIHATTSKEQLQMGLEHLLDTCPLLQYRVNRCKTCPQKGANMETIYIHGFMLYECFPPLRI